MFHTTCLRLACPPIPVVRIALIGLGQRGMKTLVRYAFIPHAEIRCIVDTDAERLVSANDSLDRSGRPKATELCGPEAWKEACHMDDIDLIYVCTDWHTHADMATYAMRCGKHVAVEVPAATTVEECRQLVMTAESTRRHCFITENCCYDLFHLRVLEMQRQGFFGEITHCEGAYIHDLTPEGMRRECGTPGNRWIERACLMHGGNPYPTHAIGPIAQLLGFHRTDRMKSLVSITSAGAQEGALPLGRVNTTLITTERGISVMLQLDVTTHRPYSRLQTVCGTRGFAQKYPVTTVHNGTSLFTGTDAERWMQRYDTSEGVSLWKEGTDRSVPNAMNYAMDARLIHCLHHGLPLDIDVYDAAEWSCLCELTQLSASRGGQPVEVPDFLSE